VAVLAAIVWRSNVPDRVDAAVATHLYAAPHAPVRALAAAVTFFGKPVVVAGAALAVAAWSWRRYRDATLAVFCPAAVTVASIVEHVLKIEVRRPRPATASLSHLLDFSYPSGHATGSCALALSVGLLVWSGGAARHRWLIVSALGAYALAVCASRVILGVHYLSDVIGAAVLATGCVLVTGWLCSRSTEPARADL
jgi:undecaprenyl-diphosphatase